MNSHLAFDAESVSFIELLGVGDLMQVAIHYLISNYACTIPLVFVIAVIVEHCELSIRLVEHPANLLNEFKGRSR